MVKFQRRTVNKLAIKSYLDASDDRFPEFGKTYIEIREYFEFDMAQYKESQRILKLGGYVFWKAPDEESLTNDDMNNRIDISHTLLFQA